MYQALYRVWRPKTFSDMVGQTSIVRTLRNQVMTGRIAHAYLFCGSRGTGKTSAAKIMARAINCEHPVNGDPCGECASCKTIGSDASFDVYEMDAASNSKVDEIRELLEKVSYPPQFGKYKVYIIDEVHMLSTAAFNALLKTLEEPPAYMVFILATTEPQKIPTTILSRCQRFDFGRFTEAELIGRMKQAAESMGASVTDDAFALIAQSAEGGMRDALSLLDMCLGAGDHVTEEDVRLVLGAADRGLLFEFAEAIGQSNGSECLRLTDRLMREGRDVQVFLKDMSRHFRMLLAAKLCGEDTMAATHEQAERYKAQAELFSAERLIRIADLFMHAEADTRWAGSARAVLEVCALRACEKPETQDVSALLERINELETRLSRIESGAVAVRTVKPKKAEEGHAPASAAENSAQNELPVQCDPVAEGEKLPKDVWNDALKILKKTPTIPMSLGKFAGYKDGVYRMYLEGENQAWVSMLNAPERRDVIEAALREAGASSPKFEALTPPKKAQDTEMEKTAERNVESLSDMFGRENVVVKE